MITELIKNLEKITADVDGKVIPSNIREGVEIFGVEGSLEPLATERREVNPSIVTHVVVPDAHHNGFHEVVVNAVTHTIDKNIEPNNIKSGKKILGVAGTLSKLSEEDYNKALELEVEILGYTNYVVKSKLLLGGDDLSVDGTKLVTTGTVEGTRLILN